MCRNYGSTVCSRSSQSRHVQEDVCLCVRIRMACHFKELWAVCHQLSWEVSILYISPHLLETVNTTITYWRPTCWQFPDQEKLFNHLFLNWWGGKKIKHLNQLPLIAFITNHISCWEYYFRKHVHIVMTFYNAAHLYPPRPQKETGDPSFVKSMPSGRPKVLMHL